MTDKRHRSGAYDSSVPNRYPSDPSRISVSGAMRLPAAYPTSAGRTSSVGFTSLSDSSMDPGPSHQPPLPPHAPFHGNSSLPSPPLGFSAPQMDSNQWAYSPTYSNQGWCYMTASPEPMNHVNHDDGDGESTRVFPSQSERTTLIEEEYTEKETTKYGRKKRNHTDTPNTVEPWEADPKDYVMSQGAMEGEAHGYYGAYFDIPGPLGIHTPCPYPQTLDIEDPNKPESNDRPGDLDVAASHRVDGADQAQEEEGWDDCAIEGTFPEYVELEDNQGDSTTQPVYQPGTASWLYPFSRH